MINFKKLYSFNNAFPEPLPERVIVNQLTYTSLDKLSDSELEKLGFSGPYYWPNDVNENRVVVFNSETKTLFSREKTVEEKLKDEPEKWENLRNIRNKILKETDWIVLKCYENDEMVPQNYVKYRQLLRDLPQNYQYSWEVKFPILEVEPDEVFSIHYDFSQGDILDQQNNG